MHGLQPSHPHALARGHQHARPGPGAPALDRQAPGRARTVLAFCRAEPARLRSSSAAQESIRLGTKEWEGLVPQSVSAQIKRLGLLGYGGHPDGSGSNDALSANGASFVSNGKAHAVERTGAVSSGQ